MTNEQAEIQQAAREHHDRWRERGQVSTPQDRLAEKVDFHISQSEEERAFFNEAQRQSQLGWAKVKELEAEVSRLRGALEQITKNQSWWDIQVMAKAALSSPSASAEREVKG